MRFVEQKIVVATQDIIHSIEISKNNKGILMPQVDDYNSDSEVDESRKGSMMHAQQQKAAISQPIQKSESMATRDNSIMRAHRDM